MDGAIGGALFPLMEGELKNGMEHTSAYVGFHKLNDAAQGFMYETLRCITGQIVQLSSTHVAQYSFAFVDLLMIYKKVIPGLRSQFCAMLLKDQFYFHLSSKVF
jgi:hypothetical protein